MNKLFPSIPLVAEEDSSFLRSTNLVGAMVDAVANKATFRDEVTEDSVLKAIDRGGKDACSFGPNPATYWVALALVVEGQIVLRVMGCPNWDEDYFVNCVTGVQETGNNFSRSGMIMVSHVGCGTWKQRFVGHVSHRVAAKLDKMLRRQMPSTRGGKCLYSRNSKVGIVSSIIII